MTVHKDSSQHHASDDKAAFRGGIQAGEHNDYSACTTWLVRQDNQVAYLMNIWRGRLDFPALVRKALELQEFYRPDFVLVEDAGSGTSLIQTLKEQGCSVSAMKPTGDKMTRMHTGSVFIEAGKILFPEKRTPALDEYFAELLAFPNGEHDDQVDSTSQFLGWLDERRRYCPPRILKLRMY